MSLKLYSPQNFATAGAKVELFNRFIELPIEFIRIPWDQWKSPEYLAKHPLGKVPTLETPEGCIYESAAILRYLARKAGKFYGNTPAECATVDQWLEFLNSQISPLNMSTIYGILGYRQVTQEQYENGKKELLNALKVVNAQLGKTEFLAGNQISIADIAFIGGLRFYLRLIFDEAARTAIPHVVQWYERLFALPQISGFFGRPWLCVKELVPEFIIPEKKEQKKEKEHKKKAEPKKVEPKKPAEPKKKKKESDDDEADEPLFPVEKKKNPLDLLPKSPFNIDDWKREFCNAPDKLEVLKKTWETFDTEGWSLWRVHYIKYEGEGVVGYLTNNLKNGHLRNIDHFRKYCFAVHGVYGVEGNYEIDGVWLWKGTEIPEEWKEHQSYDYFTFNKLDPKDPAVQALATEYWLTLTEGSLVEGKPVFDAKWFK